MGGHHRTTKTGGVPATGPPPSAWASWSPCPQVRRAGASVVGKECKLMSTGSRWLLHLWGSNHQAPCRAVTPTVTFRPFRCIPTSFWLHLPVSVSLALSPSLWLCLHFPISVSLSLAPSPCLCPHLSVSVSVSPSLAMSPHLWLRLCVSLVSPNHPLMTGTLCHMVESPHLSCLMPAG